LCGFIAENSVWINVTTNPTAEWVARQITEAFPWNAAPRHMIHDRDPTPITSHGHSRQTDCTGLTLAEWLCRTTDRIDPARVLSYMKYYNGTRAHLSLEKDAPFSRAV
jgi:hypothetical protein